jgi:methionyl-tRNA formyltransferase
MDGADVLDRQIRALNPWPVAEAWLCGERVRIWQCRLPETSLNSQTMQPGTIVAVNDQAIRVTTGDGEIELLMLQWPGKKAQSAAVFAQTRTLLGEQFSNSVA